MRLRSLDLIRYGHFTDVSVAFPQGSPDLHIVLGTNEAGKSTTMGAIEDLLFGIPSNSPRNFLHDYGALRIGTALEANGQVLEFHRRKGNKDTLLTPDETPPPTGDSALAPLLGGVDRAFFARMFCLDQERLREGGRDILDARDDVGRMLFSASTGISGLHDHLAALQREASALWGSKRAAHRRYYQADDRLKAADAALRDHTVSSAKWQDIKVAYEKARDACDALEKDIETQAAELRRLARIRRVYRDVHRLAKIDTELSEHDGSEPSSVLRLPSDTSEKVEKAAAEDAEAATRIDTLTEQVEECLVARAALTINAGLLQREKDIEQLHERRIKIRDGNAALPKRRAELDAAKANFKRIAAELEWPDDSIDALIARIPARAKVAAVRSLLTRRSGHLSALTNARLAVSDAEERASDLAKRIAATPQARDISALTALIKATHKLSDLDTQIATASREHNDTQTRCGRKFASLNPAPLDERQLVELKSPPAETIARHRDALRDLERQIQSCDERQRAAELALERDRKTYARIVENGDIVPVEELAALRQRRDVGWSIVRRRHIGNMAVPDAELEAFTGASMLAEAYERAVTAADAAADKRFEKAEATAGAMVLARRIGEQQDAIGGLQDEKDALHREQAAAIDAWQALWAGGSVLPSSPDVMLEWVATRRQVLELIEGRDTAERLLTSLRGQEMTARDRLMTQLASLGVTIDALKDLPLAALLEAATDFQRQEEKAAERGRRFETDLRAADADTEKKRKALNGVEQEWSQWNEQWALAITALSLSATSTPETAESQADAIDEMRGFTIEINNLQHERIDKIERDNAAFETDVRALVAAVAPQLSELAAEDAVLELENLLKQAVNVRNLAQQQDTTLADLEGKIANCEKTRRDAQGVIAQFKALTHVDSFDALRSTIVQSERLRTLKSDRDTLSASIIADGDGLTLEALSQECAGANLDELAAREQTLDRHMTELRSQLLEVSEKRSEARRAFEAIGGADQAARDAADRQAALAEMSTIATDYVRTRSAYLLLQSAIERFRREKQAPLLRRAGQLFAILTNSSFKSLQAELDENDKPRLVGIRPDGERVKVPGLSTGAGDQLYLALRIAAVEEYLERGIPLPFVADDLFVSYDDERAAAGFRVLAQLAQKTQVLFFTHHPHLIDVARQALATEISTVLLDRHQQVERDVA